MNATPTCHFHRKNKYWYVILKDRNSIKDPFLWVRSHVELKHLQKQHTDIEFLFIPLNPPWCSNTGKYDNVSHIEFMGNNIQDIKYFINCFVITRKYNLLRLDLEDHYRTPLADVLKFCNQNMAKRRKYSEWQRKQKYQRN
jgi:hypothetical protein